MFGNVACQDNTLRNWVKNQSNTSKRKILGRGKNDSLNGMNFVWNPKDKM